MWRARYLPSLIALLSNVLSTNAFLNIESGSTLRSFACWRSDIEVAKRPMLDICVTSQPCNKRACNKQACNKRLYGTIASHDEVWQFYPQYVFALHGKALCSVSGVRLSEVHSSTERSGPPAGDQGIVRTCIIV